MPIFRYRGKRKTGEVVIGNVQARSRDEAIELVSQQGVLPMVMDEHLPGPSAKRANPNRRASFQEIYVFTRQLSQLTKTGVPILRALEVIAQQTSSGAFSKILDGMRQGIRDGKSFSECLADHPKEFPPLYVAMVRVGEEGGNLREILLTIAEYQKRQHELMLKVRTAFSYPVFMAIVGFLTVIFILTFVMPKISRLFIDLGQQLPWVTRVLMATSHVLVQKWFFVVPAAALIISSAARWAQSKHGRAFLEAAVLRLPWAGPLILKAEFARFCRTLEMLTANGITLVRGIQIAIPTLDNQLVRQDLSKLKEGIEAGDSLSKSLQSCALVPPMMVHLIGVGEESGLLTETLHDIADTYEEEAAEAIKSFTAVLEPAMILLVGSIVGFIVIAMLLPIFSMDALAR